MWGGAQSKATGAIHYHVRLGLPDKGHAIKGLVVWLRYMIHGMGLLTSARSVGLVPGGQDGYQA